MPDEERDDENVEAVAASGETTATLRPPKPTKVLPTNRIAFTKQLDMLRAYGAAYISNNRAVTSADIGTLLQMAASTVPLATPFFIDIGLLQRTDAGLVPHADVISFHRAHEWNAVAPAHKLQHVFKATWFAQALSTRLVFRGTMEEGEALTILADAANAVLAYRNQLAMLLNFLDAVGVIERDGNLLRAVKSGPDEQLPTVPPPGPLQVNVGEQVRPVNDAPKAAAMRTVKLSAGSLTLSGDFNPFKLPQKERDLVYGIIDKMDEFERDYLMEEPRK